MTFNKKNKTFIILGKNDIANFHARELNNLSYRILFYSKSFRKNFNSIKEIKDSKFNFFLICSPNKYHLNHFNLIQNNKRILIIDSIGSLKYIYKYGYVSYIGGGMSNNGLHNILEPAVFSCPIIIGKNYKGFSEAEDLIELGGVYSVKNSNEFSKVFSKLDNTELRIKSGKINLNYILKSVEKNSKILNSLFKSLK